MKTKILLLIVVIATLSFDLDAQTINKLSKKTLNDIKLKNEFQLPLLKATRYVNFKKGSSVDFDKSITQLAITPKPYATESKAIEATLDAKKVSTNDAKLVIQGYYDGTKISIERRRRGAKYQRLWLDYNGTKDKVYRVKLSFTASFDDSNCNQLLTDIYLTGSAYKANFIIRKGLNNIDFLIESDRTGWSRVFLLSELSLLCGGQQYDNNFAFEIHSVLLRQLED